MSDDIPLIRLEIEGETLTLDISRIMLKEGMALESDWGITVPDFQAAVLSGMPSLKFAGAMVWLAKVRVIAADKQITFPEAAKLLPVAAFDVNLMAVEMKADAPVAENPTSSGTPKKGTRTTRGASAKKPRSGVTG